MKAGLEIFVNYVVHKSGKGGAYGEPSVLLAAHPRVLGSFYRRAFLPLRGSHLVWLWHVQVFATRSWGNILVVILFITCTTVFFKIFFFYIF